MEYDFGKVDALIEKDVANGFPGAVLQVSHRGKVIKHSAYGYKLRYDSEYKEIPLPEKMNLDTVFDLASNTKIFATTFVSMVMFEKELLDPDRPLVDFIPGFKSNDKINARMLLCHCAGYGPEIWFFDDKNPHGKKFFSQNRELTKKLLLNVPLAYYPGVETVYSDTGFMVLGSVIEHLSGKNLSETAKELIYTPLKLKDTTFQPLKNGICFNRIAATSMGNTCDGTMSYSNIRSGLIRGEVQDEKAYYSMEGIAGHAGLFSTSENILNLCDLIHVIYNENSTKSLFSKNTLIKFMQPAGPDNSFGCGWRINNQKKFSKAFSSKASPNTIGHTGFTGTMTLIDLDNYISIVLLTNKVHSRCYERIKYSGGTDFATGKYEQVVELIYNCMNI